MPESFLSLKAEERKEILQTLSAKLGMSPSVLEKDVWVCWALQHLFAMPGAIPMAFKGGTSLSKVFNAIKRFSEDIDVTLDYRVLVQNANPFQEGISRSQIKKIDDALRDAVSEYTHNNVLPRFNQLITDQFGKGRYAVELRDEGEKLEIHYEPLFASTNMLDHILVEFGGRNAIVPSAVCKVVPYIASELPTLLLPEAAAQVLAGARTYWEKATLIHVECNRKRLDKLERSSRHWTDLAMLADHQIGKEAIADRKLLLDVIRHKEVFYKTAGVSYDVCNTGGLQLIPDADMLKVVQADFDKMVADNMFYGDEPPNFGKIIERLTDLQKEINSGVSTAAIA